MNKLFYIAAAIVSFSAWAANAETIVVNPTPNVVVTTAPNVVVAKPAVVVATPPVAVATPRVGVATPRVGATGNANTRQNVRQAGTAGTARGKNQRRN